MDPVVAVREEQEARQELLQVLELLELELLELELPGLELPELLE